MRDAVLRLDGPAGGSGAVEGPGPRAAGDQLVLHPGRGRDCPAGGRRRRAPRRRRLPGQGRDRRGGPGRRSGRRSVEPGREGPRRRRRDLDPDREPTRDPIPHPRSCSGAAFRSTQRTCRSASRPRLEPHGACASGWPPVPCGCTFAPTRCSIAGRAHARGGDSRHALARPARRARGPRAGARRQRQCQRLRHAPRRGAGDAARHRGRVIPAPARTITCCGATRFARATPGLPPMPPARAACWR